MTMTEADAGSTEHAESLDSKPVPANPSSRLVVTPDLLLKILAVLGVVFLVYILIYLGTWLAMLN